MSSNEMRLDSQSKDPRLASVFNRGTWIIIMRILSSVREESGIAKRIRSLWSANYWVNPRLEGIESVCWVYRCKRVCFGYQNKGLLMRLPALKNSLLLRLIKFWVSSKHIVLQRLMNCSMQELLLLQID